MDSDEEEMASLRAARPGAGRSSASSAAAAYLQSAGPQVQQQARAPRSAPSAAEPAPQPDEAESEESDDAPSQVEGARMAGLPMSFGKIKAERKIDPSVHKDTARGKNQGPAGPAARVAAVKGSVQFGTRRVDAAAVAGASSRAAKADEADEAADEAARASQAASEMPRAAVQDSDSDADAGPAGLSEQLPVSHEVFLPAHEKPVTALSFDPKAARMVTGGMDGIVKFFDFGGMSEAKNFFRTVEPVEGHMVQAVSFGQTGDKILVCCSDSHARIYDRDGSAKPLKMTVKGDMYVRDMQHTKGHTQMLTCGLWHPLHSEIWLTCSLDGTLRIWDINAAGVGMDRLLPSLHVLKTLDRRNVCVGGALQKGLHPTCCTFSPNDGKRMVGGCSDGSVQLFNEKARFSKPDKILREAHAAAVTDVHFIHKGNVCNLLVTRGLDDAMKVWDCRMLSDAKGPVKSFDNLPAGHEKAGVCTSPDGLFLVCGTGSSAKDGAASVKIYNTEDFATAATLNFGKRSALRFAWPKELNQLVVGTGTGEVAMMYNPSKSRKGALNFVGKHAKTKALAYESGQTASIPVFNMTDKDDIQKFYSTGHGNMTRIRRSEARHSQKTITPMRPPTEGSASATSDQMAFAALVLKSGAKQLGLQKASGQEPDSQKALLSYQDKANNNPILIDRAYKTTQPEKLLDWSVDESEGDRRMQMKMLGDFCRKCGQKVCRCVDYSPWGEGDKKKQRTQA